MLLIYILFDRNSGRTYTFDSYQRTINFKKELEKTKMSIEDWIIRTIELPGN